MKGNFTLEIRSQETLPILQCISQFQLRPPPPHPGGGAFANFALPRGRACANPGAISELLTRTRTRTLGAAGID